MADTATDQQTDHLATATLAGLGVFVLASPLLAMAYHATADGAEFGEPAVVQAWTEPARQALGPLLEFARPELVYQVYGLVLSVSALGLVCAALALARARRGRDRRGERVCRRVATAGYGLMVVGTLVTFVVPEGGLANLAYLGLLVPGMLATLLGTTAVGVTMLRRRVGPPVARVLLTAAVPGFAAVSTVGGHNAVGMAFVFAGWAMVAWWLLRQPPAPSGAGDAAQGRRQVAGAGA